MNSDKILRSTGLKVKDFYTLDELAAAVKLKKRTLQTYCNPHSKYYRLPAIKKGTSYLVSKEDAVAFISGMGEKKILTDPKILREFEKEIMLSGNKPNDFISALTDSIRRQRVANQSRVLADPETTLKNARKKEDSE